MSLNTILNISSLSKEAKNIISSIGGVLRVDEKVTYDGFDSLGPEAELWDLYVTIKNGETTKQLHYHRENWFDGVVEKYSLC